MRTMILVLLCLFAATSLLHAQDTDAQSKETGTVTISRSEFEELKSKVSILEDELNRMKSGESIVQQPQNAVEDAAANEQKSTDTSVASESTPTQPSGGKQLALPDISLIIQAKGKLSSDRNDSSRDHLRLSEAELSIQGYVYPNVKADAYLTTSPEEGAPMQVEEAYLTYLGVKKGINIYLGKKRVPFGRSNLLHSHSWLYARQPLVLRNLVAEESLTGEGIDASYLIPTKSNLFAQLDLGTWTGEGPGDSSNPPDVIVGPGASFADRFNTARLWTGYPINDYNEIELGASYAKGSADGQFITGHGQAELTGFDMSYRHFWEIDRRLLLRAESVRRHESAGFESSSSNGYYLFGNYRPNKYASIGLLYDWSAFPQLPDLHESALSLILTKQLSEQYYIRLQATHGARPDGSYNELLLQWVWGVGPHTHNLD